MDMQELDITYGGETITLNAALIKKMKLSYDTVEAIKETHYKRMELEHKMAQTPPINKDILKRFANQLLEINRELQALWGFKQDDNYFRFWELPHCLCPKMDNGDNYPYGYYTQVDDCPIHGGFVAERERLQALDDLTEQSQQLNMGY